jgi:xanthine dehydrogenase accessory factor
MEPLTPVSGGAGGAAILTQLLDAIDHRKTVAIATIVATDRSVPRRAGSKMLVFADGTTSGTIGGGEMEARVITEALETLASGKPRQLTYSLIDAAAGDPGVCGGAVELFLEPHMPQPTVYVIGIGHVGQAVVELAQWLGYRVAGWDDRSDLVESIGNSASSLEILSGSIEDALEITPIDDQTMVVMTTRNVGLDIEILPPILASPASFIGIMGSQRRWDITRQNLADAGEAEANLSRVHSPIGLDINAETPVEIAVSILAEVIAHQRNDQ